MAIAIKSIPILKDKEAESFQETIEKNSKKRESIDFKIQLNSANQILEKAKLR
jgi:hypothetical protein